MDSEKDLTQSLPLKDMQQTEEISSEDISLEQILNDAELLEALDLGMPAEDTTEKSETINIPDLQDVEPEPVVPEYLTKEPEAPVEPPKKKTWILPVIIISLVLVIGAAIFGFMTYSRMTKDDGLTLSNIEVNGIQVGGMTKADVLNALTPLANSITKSDVKVTIGDRNIVLTPEQTGAKLDLNAVYNQIYSYGREGSGLDYYKAKKTAENTTKRFSIYDFLNLDTNKIRDEIQKTADSMNGEFKESEIKLSGKMPPLDLEHYDETAECEVLTVTIGVPGIGINVDEVYEHVVSCFSTGNYEFTVVPQIQMPAEVDFTEIQKTKFVQPVDAKMDPLTNAITQETYGYGFDIAEAQKLLKAAKPGDVVKIPFTFIQPKVTEIQLKESIFPDVLFETTTYQSSNYNRATNLRLACEAINGTVVMPGEVFSFNDVVGERTYEKGYLDAIAYVNNKPEPDVGGGVCQVASTLYYSCMHCDFEIVERYEHMYPSDYVPLGMDATVYYGALDYQFRNNTKHPIRIDAESESDGYVYICIKGVDDRDTYVDMEYVYEGTIDAKTVYEHFTEANKGSHYEGQILQYPADGCAVTTYRLRYDKATDTLISREYEAYSRYDAHDKIVVKIDDATTEPSTEPTTEPTSEPTTEPTTEPVTEPSTVPTESEEPTTEPTTEPETEATEPVGPPTEEGSSQSEDSEP